MEKIKIRLFLIGILCGVMMAAVVTFAVTIPGIDELWRVEITKRGGGDWSMDKEGHFYWRWTAQRISDGGYSRTVIVPRPRPSSYSSPNKF
jgi:hypothetical protein